MNRHCLTAVAVLVTSVAEPAGPVVSQNSEALTVRLRHYAEAVGMPPLGTAGLNEVRMWTRGYMDGAVWAYAASNGSERTCETRSDWSQEATSIEPGKCSRSRRSRLADDALQLLPTLARYDKQDLNCPEVMDGWNIMVEGVVNGAAFAFEYSNADNCDDDAARAVKRLLSIATKAE